jgi:hypothetical protein
VLILEALRKQKHYIVGSSLSVIIYIKIKSKIHPRAEAY